MRSRPLPRIVLSTIAMALAVSACSGAPDADPADAAADAGFPTKITTCGFTSEVKAKPQRAVTMNQSATEIALALEVSDQLVGTGDGNVETISPKWKDEYDKIPKLADEYPSYEKLLSVKPDFVYAVYSSAFNKEALGPRQGLEEIGIATYLSPFGCQGGGAGTKVDVSFESVWDDIAAVAEAFGVSDRAAKIKADQQAMLDDIADAAEGEGLDIFWLDMIGKTASVGAGKGGPQLIIDAVQGHNVFGDQDGGWADASWEDVVKSDPDVIVLADLRGDTIASKKKFLASDPVLRQLDAVKNERYIEIPFVEGTPGVRLAEGAKLVSDQLAELDLS